MNARRTSFWKRRLKERVSNSDKEVSCCIQLEKFYLRKRICESRPGLEVQGCISCSATFDSPPNDSEWMSIARKAENRETQAASKSPEPAGRTCVGLDLPVYRHYENSLHVASKEGSRIRHMPTFGLFNKTEKHKLYGDQIV